MAIRTIDFTVTDDLQMVPRTPQDAGVQGDDRATTLVFHLPEEVLNDYAMYLEYIDSDGGYDKSEDLQRPNQEETVSFTLPLAWTQHGGNATVRLVCCRKEGDDIQEIAHTFEGYLRFAQRQTAIARVKSLIQQTIEGLCAKCRAAAQEATESATAAAAEAAGAQEDAVSAATAAWRAEDSAATAGIAAATATQGAERAEQAATQAEGAAVRAEQAVTYVTAEAGIYRKWVYWDDCCPDDSGSDAAPVLTITVDLLQAQEYEAVEVYSVKVRTTEAGESTYVDADIAIGDYLCGGNYGTGSVTISLTEPPPTPLIITILYAKGDWR